MRRFHLTVATVMLLALVSAFGFANAATQTAPAAPAKGMFAVTYYFLPG